MAPDPLLLFDSGNLALDLLNTLRFPRGEVVDDLRTPQDLLAWLAGRGPAGGPYLAGALRSPPAARVLLTEAQNLRGDVGRLLGALQARGVIAPHTLYGVNRVLAASREAATLHVEPGGARLVEVEVGESSLAALSPIARAAARLVIDVDADRVRRCASEECARWFVDTSKGGRRRWCSMATCGNRAKAAKHRARVERS